MIELDRARERIEPIEKHLIEAHNSAVRIWRDLLTDHPQVALPLDRTARAKVVHCHLEAQVARRIDTVAGVTATDALGFFALRIDPYILLRLKYVGNDGAPHNVSTTQQRLLAQQTYDEDMVLALTGDLGMAPPTLLTCGYTLTDKAEVGRIEIRRDCKGHLPWRYDIYGGEAVVEPIFIPGMTDEARPAVVTSSRKAQRKGEGQAETG